MLVWLAAAMLALAPARAQDFEPGAVLAKAFPAMRDFRRATKPEITALEAGSTPTSRPAPTKLPASGGDGIALAAELDTTCRPPNGGATGCAPLRADDTGGNIQDADGSYGPASRPGSGGSAPRPTGPEEVRSPVLMPCRPVRAKPGGDCDRPICADLRWDRRL